MTNPDYRAMCAELAEEVEHLWSIVRDDNNESHSLADRARVLLDKHEPQPPADGEVGELVETLKGIAYWTRHGKPGGIVPCLFEIRQADRLDRAAYLLRHQHPQPVAHVDVGIEWMPCVKLPITVHVRDQRPGETHSSTREGITPLRSDDLIMRGVQGEEYPIGRELFEQTYKLLPTPEATND